MRIKQGKQDKTIVGSISAHLAPQAGAASLIDHPEQLPAYSMTQAKTSTKTLPEFIAENTIGGRATAASAPRVHGGFLQKSLKDRW